MFKKQILQKLKGYNEVLYAEDYDFLCRVILNKYNVKYIDKPLIKYRVRFSGINKSKQYYQEIVSQIVNENYRQALKNRKIYNPSEYIKRLDSNIVEKFKVNNMKFEEAKELIRENKKIIGIINILFLLLKSKIKRKEMINKFCLNCVCKFE
ncbi:MAG TPA: hypothetical protein DG753_08845 [Clostridium sp.]|nr:hypothetical protein [Clostridium sp.]